MIDPRLLKQSLIAFGGVYLLSFLGHQEPLIATLSFFLIIGLTAYATFQKPFWGILILTAELLIGSQGHLFDITLLDFRVSLRMGIFLMVALVATLHAIKNHSFKTLFLMPHRTLYLLLGFFVLFSIGGGIWRGNSLSFLYQDANAYLFFLLVPFYHRALSHQATEKIKQLLTIWMSGIVFQAVLTLSLLFLYGHVDFFWKMLIPLYAWLRDLRLMEIGLFRLNVYRIFMQSQLWSLTGFFAFLSIWLATPREGRKSSIVSLLFKPHAALSAILIGALTVLITSLSRSFWIGAVAAFVIMILHFLYTTRPSIRQISTHALHLSIILFFSLLMMTTTQCRRDR